MEALYDGGMPSSEYEVERAPDPPEEPTVTFHGSSFDRTDRDMWAAFTQAQLSSYGEKAYYNIKEVRKQAIETADIMLMELRKRDCRDPYTGRY